MPYQEPEFLPWDGQRVPITFVGGYLGAGKTTLINAVLAETDRPIAVIVNDIGDISIDARLVRRRHGDTLELADGCVCCSSIDGFGAAFDQIRSRPTPPDHVLVELSGVAEPANVVPWGRSAGFVLDGVVVVVAVDQLTDASVPAWVRAHLDGQIRAADILVLTKVDLASAEQTERARAVCAGLAPGVPIVERRGDVGALGRFLALGGHRGDPASIAGPTLFDLHHTQTVPIDGPLDRAGLDALLDSLPAHVVRAKGVVETPDGELLLVNVVGKRRDIVPLLASESRETTDLVVISLHPGSDPERDG